MKNKIPKDYEIRNYITEIKSDVVEGKRYLYGFIPYGKESVDMGFTEVIAPSAFTKSLNESNIIALVDHDSSKVLGSKNNGTLQFDNRADGLYITCEIPNTSYANDAYEIINRGDVNTMSFGFNPIKSETINGIYHLKEVKLYEVSFMVSFPAYADTNSVALTRSRFIKEKRNIDLEKLGEILAKEKIEAEEEIKVIRETIDNLKQSIGTINIEEQQEPIAEEVKPSADDTLIKSLEDIVELESILI